MQAKAFGKRVSSIVFFRLALAFVYPALTIFNKTRQEVKKKDKVTFIMFPQLEYCSCNIPVEQCMNGICIGNNTSKAKESKGFNFDQGVYRRGALQFLKYGIFKEGYVM